MNRAARLLLTGALVALAVAASPAAQVAIVGTAQSFAQGAVEQESALRGPMGWPRATATRR